MMLAANCVLAANVRLTWEPNTEPALADYKIHYGSVSGSYTTTVDVTRNTTFSISNLQAGNTYFFAATAYDADGVDSDYFNEVAYSVPAANQPPVAQNGTLNVTEDERATGSLSATDPAAQSLTFTFVAPPAKGVVTLSNSTSGNFTYTPNANGTDTFSFKVNDGAQDSNIASLAVNIDAVNDVPMVNPDSGVVTAGSSITINVLANDTDVDGDNLTIASLTQGIGGQAVISSNAVKYTPKGTFSGIDSFSYTASDGKGGSASGTVSIQVFAANKPPVASDASISVQTGSSVARQLSATDPDGNALRFSLVSLPSKGNVSVTNATDGTFTYTANSGLSGTDSFTFKASDGKADSNIATVQVTLDESGKVVFAVNSGGPQYIDSNGIKFAADTRYSGGYTASRSSAISDTVDDTLYQTEQYGDISYTIPVINGHYWVTLKFAEIVWGTSAKRVFDVLMEDTEVLSDMDIFKVAGKARAYDVRIPVRVTDGSLNLDFRTDSDNTKLSAVLVQQLDSDFRWGVNTGGPRTIDSTDMVYEHDVLSSAGATAKISTSIAGTEDPALYQSERSGAFAYDIPVPNGVYRVTLKFAKITKNATGQRVFSATAEGQTVLSNLDIFRKVAKFEAYDYPLVVTVTDSMLNLGFVPKTGQAKVSAI
jgi:hypothetical protein